MKRDKIPCPVCDEPLTIDADMEVGDVLVCQECVALLKVINLNPIQLEVESVAEWDDEEDQEL